MKEVNQPILEGAGKIQADRARRSSGAPVRREYEVAGKGNDPAQRAVAASLLKAAKPNGPKLSPKNDLGAALRPGREAEQIELEFFARRHMDCLADDDLLFELDRISDEITKELNLNQYHSSSVVLDRIQAALKKFSEEPTVANEEALRHEKSLSQSEHTRVQFTSTLRLRRFLSTKLPPVALRIYAAASDLLKIELARLRDAEAERYAEWGLTPVPGALELELARLANDFDTSISGLRKGGVSEGPLYGLLKVLHSLYLEREAANAAG